MTTQTLTLTDFLLARIAEDEAVAKAATSGPWEWQLGEEHDSGIQFRFLERTGDYAWIPGEPDGTVLDATSFYDTRGYLEVSDADADHISRWDPARVVAECEAKRRIVELHCGAPLARNACDGTPLRCVGCGYTSNGKAHAFPCPTVRALALPYADHEDFREEWR